MTQINNIVDPLHSNNLTLTTILEELDNNIIGEITGEPLEEPNHEPSQLVALPLEILNQIIELSYYNRDATSISSSLESFSKSIPLLSKTINQVALPFLYKYAVFTRPHSFAKFSANLSDDPSLGQYVRVIDFQEFTSVGLGRTNKMNQEIQMVTSRTIFEALKLTKNLWEFLASENIQDDLDVNVLSQLFNHSPLLQSLDFCGATGQSFSQAFEELVIDISTNEHLLELGLHDCTGLGPDVFKKILPPLVNLKKVDLSHTQITSKVLFDSIAPSARLTHLNLSRCSRLTTRDLIDFLTFHPSVINDSLRWLNLQIDSSVVSPLNEDQLLFMLKHLKAPKLQYLNLGGLPVKPEHLAMIRRNFPMLESVNISFADLDIEDINTFLLESKIKVIDITGIKKVSRWKILQILKRNDNSLEAIEFDQKALMDLSQGSFININPTVVSFNKPFHMSSWKYFDNEGRRAWLFRIDPNDPDARKPIGGDLSFYDLETGKKITKKVKKPEFLKYVSRKINCSTGYYNMERQVSKEEVWPVEFTQRGIYNYYSLNTK